MTDDESDRCPCGHEARALYGQAYRAGLEARARAAAAGVEPMQIEATTIGRYSQDDVNYTLDWWMKFGRSLAFPPNRLNKNPIHSLNQLIRPSTIQQMTRPLRGTS